MGFNAFKNILKGRDLKEVSKLGQSTKKWVERSNIGMLVDPRL